MNEEIKEIILNDISTGYFISNKGRVYSTKKSKKLKERKLMTDKDGYKTIVLQIEGKEKFCRVNRLVAIYFLDIPEKYATFNIDSLVVNHKDGDKSNNDSTNLEWCTQQENIDHAWRTGLSCCGEKSSNHKLTEEQVHEICKFLETGKFTYSEIKEKIGKPCTVGIIKNIAYKKTWKEISDMYDLSIISNNIKNKNSNKLKISDVIKICKLIERGHGSSEISNIIGCTRDQVVNIRFHRT